MKTCFYCGKGFDEFDEPIRGFDDNKTVIACEDCEMEQENFIRAIYYEDEVFKRFAIQYKNSDDPATIYHEYIIRGSFEEALEYAQENYNEDELIGIEFDQYVNVHDKELTYDEKTGYWTVLDNC